MAKDIVLMCPNWNVTRKGNSDLMGNQKPFKIRERKKTTKHEEGVYKNKIPPQQKHVGDLGPPKIR